MKYIYLVKHGDTILDKFLEISEATECVNDFNFDLPKSMKKAKLFRAEITKNK